MRECNSAEARRAVIEYSRLPNFQGRVNFYLNCGTYFVEEVTLEPAQPWPLEKALSTYGPGYCYRRFNVINEPQEAEVEEYGRRVENARGNVVQVENRSRGLVLNPDSSDRIRLIIYQKGPD